ncbi:hypothetical protein BBJ28_00001637 [Nothophytophthora sp. Chile5]|nr:hypothetical protein BBJ28_00001637 [Nothophytophthora sp. Chile5]
MLAHTMREFDQHTHENGSVVDTTLWKAAGSRDDLRVYREREAGATCAALAYALEKTEVLPRGSTIAPLTPPGMLMTGYCRGKVENAMDAVASSSQEDLALVTSFLHEDVADCAVLHTMEAPTASDPFHFLGFKYFVQRAPAVGSKQLAKNRDSLYLEYTGYTETERGERLGFHLMHSVDLPQFPDLSAHNSARTLQSVRYLYRQQSEDIVEVFMQGNLEIAGAVASTLMTDTFIGISTLVACAEAKRLTQMWKAQQSRNAKQATRQQQSRRAASASECSMCRQKKKLFGGASLAACEVCAEFICARCRSEKKVFEMDADGILGRFRKLSVCKCCVLAANKPLSQPEEPQGLIVMSHHLRLDREASRDRRRRGTSSAASSGTRSRSGSSCPSTTSSDECSQAPNVLRRARNGSYASYASTASTVSSAGYRESPVTPQSPMGMKGSQRQPHQPVYAKNDQQMELQLQRYGGRTKAVEPSRRIQHFGGIGGQQVQQQMAIREKHSMVAHQHESSRRRGITAPQPPAVEHSLAVRRKQHALVASHRETLRRTHSTGSSSSLPSPRNAGGGYRCPPGPSVSQPNDLFARMVELNRVAESTYNTAQQNGVYLSQQMRSRRRAS